MYYAVLRKYCAVLAATPKYWMVHTQPEGGICFGEDMILFGEKKKNPSSFLDGFPIEMP